MIRRWSAVSILAPSFRQVLKRIVMATSGKNKLGVKNSLVNNINARKKKKISRPKKKSTVSKKNYKKMQNDWK